MRSKKKKASPVEVEINNEDIFEKTDNSQKEHKKKKKKQNKGGSNKETKKQKKERKRKHITMSYKKLDKEIRGWGYEYNAKKYLATMFLVLVGMVTVGYFFLLKIWFVAILALCAVLAMPFIVLAQFAYIGNNDKFEDIVNYLEQMILSFKRSPKILSAMKDSRDLATGKMRKCLNEAIEIIETDTESQDVYEKAFSIIEKEYRCSRIKTLHRFMLNVEMESSTNYQNSIDNLYSDIRSWVTRTYKYQAELSATKSKIMIIMGLSLGISLFFTYMLKRAEEATASSGNDYALHMIDSGTYQVATTIFIITFILIFTFLNTKVNGFWLVNDIAEGDGSEIYKNISAVENYDTKGSRKRSIIAASFGVPFLIIGFIIGNLILKVLGIAIIFFMLFKNTLNLKAKKKAVERELVKEFPIWLRDIAVNLNNMIVVRAIAESYDYAAPVMKPFITRFIERSEEDPTSIKPYTEFLGVFNVSELSTAMKMLYTIKMLSAEDSARQVNELIDRNQTLLESSEKLKQEDSVAGVSFISLLPMLLMSIKLMIDLAVMMVAFFSLTNGAF